MPFPEGSFPRVSVGGVPRLLLVWVGNGVRYPAFWGFNAVQDLAPIAHHPSMVIRIHQRAAWIIWPDLDIERKATVDAFHR